MSALYVKMSDSHMWFVDPENHGDSKWRVLQGNRLTISVDEGPHQNVWFRLVVNEVLPSMNTKTVQKRHCP